MKYKLLLINIFSILLISISCSKDYEEIIPTHRFTAQINNIATDPLYNQKNPFTVYRDSHFQTIGNSGVAIFMLTPEEYYVFDLMCPHEKKMSSLVELEKDGINCICPTCGSTFAIANEYGGLLKGPSKHSLYKYQAEVRSGTLYIWN